MSNMGWLSGRVESTFVPPKGPVRLTVTTMHRGQECPVEVKCWGQEGEVAKTLTQGTFVWLSIALSGRRYQERLFTDVNVTALAFEPPRRAAAESYVPNLPGMYGEPPEGLGPSGQCPRSGGQSPPDPFKDDDIPF